MRSFIKIYNRPVVATVLTSLFIFAIVLVAQHNGLLEPLELMAYDMFIRLQPPCKEHSPIVIIEISEQDIQNQGRWPMTDKVLAKTLRKIISLKPRAVGLDIFRDIPVPPGTSSLNSVLNEHNNIVCVMKFGYGGVAPPPAVRGTSQLGFSDILVDPGGTVRRGLLFLSDRQTIYYSFPLRLALLYLREEEIYPLPDPENPHYLKLGPTTIHPLESSDGAYVDLDARGYQFLIDFKERGQWFKSYSLTEFLEEEIEPDVVKEGIVLIGMGGSVESVKDFFYTPLSRGFREKRLVPGVVLHAHILNQLLRFAHGTDSPISCLNEIEETSLILIWSFLGGIIGLKVRSPWKFTVLGATGIFVTGIGAYLAIVERYWIPSVAPAIAWVSSASVVTACISNIEKRQKSLLMNLFAKHVSPEIAEMIWKERELFLNADRPQSRRLTVTVLFSDLRGFTSLAEKMDPQQHVDWLNTYMDSMTRIIMEHGGVVDDYAGDGIKANFGVPFPRTSMGEIANDARNAVDCALAMEREMERLCLLWQKEGLPRVGMRIGIYTGEVIAGAIGSSERLKYTTVGDTVNTAARLENYNKNIARDRTCRIFIGETTLRYLGTDYEVRMIDKTKLKGKDQPVTIYMVVGKKTS